MTEVLNWEKFPILEGKFHSGGNYKDDSMTGSNSDPTIWYQPVTVKLCFSPILMCLVTTSQCLQQINRFTLVLSTV